MNLTLQMNLMYTRAGLKNDFKQELKANQTWHSKPSTTNAAQLH